MTKWGNNMTKNRWLIALSAIAIHLSIGGAYAYSVYKKPLVETMGWSETEVTLAFTIMMALAGTSAAFFGKFVEKMVQESQLWSQLYYSV